MCKMLSHKYRPGAVNSLREPPSDDRLVMIIMTNINTGNLGRPLPMFARYRRKADTPSKWGAWVLDSDGTVIDPFDPVSHITDAMLNGARWVDLDAGLLTALATVEASSDGVLRHVAEVNPLTAVLYHQAKPH